MKQFMAVAFISMALAACQNPGANLPLEPTEKIVASRNEAENLRTLAQKALEGGDATSHPTAEASVTQVKIDGTTIDIDVNSATAVSEAIWSATRERISSVVLDSLPTDRSYRVQFSVEGKPWRGSANNSGNQTLQTQAFQCPGETRPNYPISGLARAWMLGAKIMIDPGHGKVLNNGVYQYERQQNASLENFNEDLNNINVAREVTKVLESSGAQVDTTRDVRGNSGLSAPGGEAMSNYGARYYLGFLKPRSIWYSEGDKAPELKSCEQGQDLRSRPFNANAADSDVFISLHSDSSSGFKVFYSVPTGFDNLGAGYTPTPRTIQAQSKRLADLIVSEAKAELGTTAIPVLQSPILEEKAVLRFARMPAVLVEIGAHGASKLERDAVKNTVIQQRIGRAIQRALQTFFAERLPVVTPPSTQPTFTSRIVRNGTGFAVNYNVPSGNWVFLFQLDGTADQRWTFQPVRGTGRNTVYTIRRDLTNQCLNGYLPRNYSTVNTFSCSSTDGDQLYQIVPAPTYGPRAMLIQQVQRTGSYCLNANSPSNLRTITLWTCSSSDTDQIFVLPEVPDSALR